MEQSREKWRQDEQRRDEEYRRRCEADSAESDPDADEEEIEMEGAAVVVQDLADGVGQASEDVSRTTDERTGQVDGAVDAGNGGLCDGGPGEDDKALHGALASGLHSIPALAAAAATAVTSLERSL